MVFWKFLMFSRQMKSFSIYYDLFGLPNVTRQSDFASVEFCSHTTNNFNTEIIGVPLVAWFGGTTLALSIALSAIVILAWIWSPGVTKSPKIPGPLALPFIGTRWMFWSRYKLSKLHEAYEDMFRRYGPVFAERVGGGARGGPLLVSVAARTAVEAVLRSPARRPYRPPIQIVKEYRRRRPDRYASTGLVNEQGEEWYHLRRHLTSELTSPHKMQSFVPELNLICDDFLALLESCRDGDGQVRYFDQLTNRMGLESVCGLVLGSRLGFLEQLMCRRATTLAAAVKANFQAQRDCYYGLPLWKYLPTRLYKSYTKSEDTIYAIVSNLIEEVKSKKKGCAQDDPMQEIFLQILENPELDMRDKKAGIIDFITAGIETLANSLVFVLYLLSTRPDWQKRIRAELPSGGALDSAGLSRAGSVRAALLEAFRLLPIAPFLARLLEAPLTADGYHLEAGTFVLVHVGAACRQEENFWRAREYLPERWCTSRTPHAPALVAPFGRGRRMCPGKRFVELELQLIVAKIIQKWRVEFDEELEVQFDFVLSPKSPVSLRLVEW